jgi:biotin carboxylase
MFTINGETFCIGITEKGLTGKPYFVEYNHVFPAKLNDKVQEKIINSVTKALHKVNIKNGATHTEVKFVNDKCIIIEINARLAGGMIPELIYHSTGVDLLDQQINAVTGNAAKFPVVFSSYSGIQFIVSDRNGILKEIRNVDKVKLLEGIKKIVINNKMGTDVYVPKDAYDRVGFIIANSKEYESTKELLQTANELIQLDIQAKEEKKEHNLSREVPLK